MKHQRTRQTDAHEVLVHTDWTAVKRETFAGVFSLVIQIHQTLSPTNQRLFYFMMAHGCPSQTGLCTYKNKNSLLLNPFTTLSVMVRITVVIKASLKTFCL